ncbi:Nmr based structural model of the Ubch8-ubiquitin complex [Karstenula rhodostoma CBS 690.94]|uniref:Nmr based structural model of the Ubch8-ubiquitin complex n=1 Tax=Karstenula rhodostoma CBS 690.94 TaxID=1392251 RepID=A0A9P4UHW8_9PLEO|nr:Nmr based structural model of the Ubch8-ubiquitin complex [Karstenula rhodostoma CBS 690.94]
MEISFKTLDGVERLYKVSPADTIEDVMSDVQNKVCIPPDQQRLMFNGERLELGRILSDYNVQPDSRLYILTRVVGC